MNKHGLLLSGLAALLINTGSAAFANSPFGGGGEIPIPFGLTNQTVELAEGELYVLVGVIRLRAGVEIFNVDLKTHPWLASAKRQRDPSYPIDCESSLRGLENVSVKILARARGHIVVGNDGALRNEIYLEIVGGPVNMR